MEVQKVDYIALKKTALSCALGLCSDRTCSWHRGESCRACHLSHPPVMLPLSLLQSPGLPPCWLREQEAPQHYLYTNQLQHKQQIQVLSCQWLLCQAELHVLTRMSVRFSVHEGLSSGKHLCRGALVAIPQAIGMLKAG